MLRASQLAGVLAIATFSAVVATPKAAKAETSSWFFVGGGASMTQDPSTDPQFVPALQIDLGLGTSPAHPVIFGVIARSSTAFGAGTDWSGLARVTTRGFSTGQWGLALDAGVYRRMWGGYNDWGPTADLQFGGPWGLQLSTSASLGIDGQRSYTAVFGIDLLKLTVHRLSGENWWPNPRPSWRPPRQQDAFAPLTSPTAF